LYCKRLEVFLYSPVKTLPIFQNAASRLVAVLNRREKSSQVNLEKVRRGTGGDEPSSDQNILPVTDTKLAGVWKGRGHSWSVYTV
jgi:hypothetical protein